MGNVVFVVLDGIIIIDEGWLSLGEVWFLCFFFCCNFNIEKRYIILVDNIVELLIVIYFVLVRVNLVEFCFFKGVV